VSTSMPRTDIPRGLTRQLGASVCSMPRNLD